MYLVAGATGNVGGEVVVALAGSGAQVRALTRSPGTAGLPSGVEAAPGDLNRPETLADALAGVRGVFLLPGYEDMEGVLAEIAKAGVERVVLLSGSSAQSGDTGNAMQMTAQMPVAYVDAFFDFYVDGSLDESQVLPTVHEVLGREPRTFAQWAAAHVEAFR